MSRGQPYGTGSMNGLDNIRMARDRGCEWPCEVKYEYKTPGELCRYMLQGHTTEMLAPDTPRRICADRPHPRIPVLLQRAPPLAPHVPDEDHDLLARLPARRRDRLEILDRDGELDRLADLVPPRGRLDTGGERSHIRRRMVGHDEGVVGVHVVFEDEGSRGIPRCRRGWPDGDEDVKQILRPVLIQRC